MTSAIDSINWKGLSDFDSRADALQAWEDALTSRVKSVSHERLRVCGTPSLVFEDTTDACQRMLLVERQCLAGARQFSKMVGWNLYLWENDATSLTDAYRQYDTALRACKYTSE